MRLHIYKMTLVGKTATANLSVLGLLLFYFVGCDTYNLDLRILDRLAAIAILVVSFPVGLIGLPALSPCACGQYGDAWSSIGFAGATFVCNAYLWGFVLLGITRLRTSVQNRNHVARGSEPSAAPYGGQAADGKR